MASNKLAINTKKCQILPIPYFQRKCFCSLDVWINNQLVSPSSTAKYLGLTKDTQRNFDHHILLLIKKLSSFAGL